MIIDKNPVLDMDNLTVTVNNNIDTTEEVEIYINGLLSLLTEDFVDITDNIITVTEGDIDFLLDSIFVSYTKI